MLFNSIEFTFFPYQAQQYTRRSPVGFFLLLVFLLFAQLSFSQKVEVIKKSTVTLAKVKFAEDFALLESGIDTSSITFVGTFQVSGPIGKPHIIDHFFLIQEKAKKLGANACMLVSHKTDSARNLSTTTMSTYFADDNVKRHNERLKPVNVVYLFGDDRIYLKNKYSTFGINGEIRRIHNTSEYFQYHLQEGEVLEVSKGGVVEIIGERHAPAIYLRLSGLAVGVSPVPQGVTITGGGM
jgi:hypothetical protein